MSVDINQPRIHRAAEGTIASGKYAGCQRVLIDGGMVRKLTEREIQEFRAAVERAMQQRDRQ